VQAQVGRIPAANGGTLFLDEVSELPLGMQAKLLRFLEEKEIQRLGAAEVSRVDVRVIAASNVDLAGRTGRGNFAKTCSTACRLFLWSCRRSASAGKTLFPWRSTFWLAWRPPSAESVRG